MRIAKPIKPIEIDRSLEVDIEKNIHELTRFDSASKQPQYGDDEMSTSNLDILLRGISESSTREIENLIDELHGLRKRLETEGARIQSDIAKYAELSRGAMQLTMIISDNVKRLPATPSNGR
jgi:hypothetical protein